MENPSTWNATQKLINTSLVGETSLEKATLIFSNLRKASLLLRDGTAKDHMQFVDQIDMIYLAMQSFVGISLVSSLYRHLQKIGLVA